MARNAELKQQSRGKRGKASRSERAKKWVDNGGLKHARKKIESITDTTALSGYPNQLAKVKVSGQAVLQRYTKHYGAMRPRDLPPAASAGILLFPTPPSEDIDSTHPPYLAIRADDIIPSNVAKHLVTAFDCVMSSGVAFGHVHSNRSTTPGLHFGTWELSANSPYLTADTRNQTPKAILAIDHFLNLISRDIAPRLNNLLKWYFPTQYARQQRAYSRVSYLMRKEPRYKTCDFKGAFFTVAVKEGASELIHLDFNNDPDTITWVVPLGHWISGGAFCAPQLDTKIPVKQGQALGGLTRRLAHATEPITGGRRIALTLFSDRCLMSHTDSEKGH